MHEQPHPGSGRPRTFLHGMLFLFAAAIGIEAGAGLFTTVVVFPVWAGSPEAATGFRPGVPYYLEEGDFFMFSSSLAALASIVTLVAGWRAPAPLGRWLRMATISFLIVAVWSAAYFVPIQDTTFKGAAGLKISREELAAGLQRFVALNYVRQLVILFAFGAALHALGLSYRMRGNKE